MTEPGGSEHRIFFGRWREQAACRNPLFDPEWWFPDNTTSKKFTALVLKVCENCEVRTECGAHGDKIRAQQGIWGGRNRRTCNDEEPPQ